MKWYLMVLKNYAGFKGRARRKEYWFFALFNILFAMVAMLIDNLLGSTLNLGSGITLPYGYVYIIYSLAMFIPGIAVAVRRLHDVGKSGWMFFIILIPLIGAIWLLVLLFTDSNKGENKYGPNPKKESSFDEEALDSHLTN